MRVIGTHGNDTIAFAAGVNVVDGQGGKDSITAGAGNDILSGEPATISSLASLVMM